MVQNPAPSEQTQHETGEPIKDLIKVNLNCYNNYTQ